MATPGRAAAGRDPDQGVNVGLYTYPVLMAADILVIATPTWLGQPSSVCRRVMERMDPDETLSALSRFVVDEAPLPELMNRIASTARDLIAAVVDASITFTSGDDNGWTVGTTGELATRLDEAQYALGHGPCIAAGAGGETLLIRDFALEQRWPAYAPVALEAGVHSSLSVPFPIQQHVIAALNLYSEQVDPFTDDDVVLAQQIASQALKPKIEQYLDAQSRVFLFGGVVLATAYIGLVDWSAVH